MKSLVFAFLLLIAGAFAVPQTKQASRSIVEDRIINRINLIKFFIRGAGLDPLRVPRGDVEYAPIPGIFEVRAFVENLVFTGASDISIDYLNYNLLLNRLRFEFSLPELKLQIGSSGVELVLYENVDRASASGSLAVRGVTLSGEISFNVSLEEGITVRSISLDLSFGRTESDLTIVAFEEDYSATVNALLQERIPGFLENNRNEINRGLEVVVRRILDEVL